MEEQNKIIVFHNFNNAIDASIVKTKLDAYGIPCFLTEENLVNLYAGNSFIPFQVRLHLFASDKEAANEILAEQNLTIDDAFINECPRCESRSVKRDFPKKLSEDFFIGMAVLFFGVFFPERKVYHCLECDYEF